MDWTSVFDEDGQEDFIIAQQLTMVPRAPRISRLVSILYHYDDESFDDEAEGSGMLDMSEHRLFELSAPSSEDEGGLKKCRSRDSHLRGEGKAYSLRALYYLSINYILGVGCLGIPYAFARAGFVLCILILLIVTLFSYMTVMWVAESGERYQERCERLHPPDPNHHEQSPLLARQQQDVSHQRSHESDERHHHLQNWNRYEVVDLVGFYLGPFHKILYQISLMALMYIGLLAYSQVFCGAIAELIWGDRDVAPPTAIPQLLFAAMVVPLSCIELDEQVNIQSVMAAVRFLAIFIMVFGSIMALCLDDSHVTGDHGNDVAFPGHVGRRLHGPPYWALPEQDHMSYTICFSGFGVAFSTSLFSQLFQHSIPGLLRPLRDQPSKMRRVPETLGASLLTTTIFYLLLGTAAASFFGGSTRSSVNLNFTNFTMGLDPTTAPLFLVQLVRLAGSIVVIFPALDTISVFPLIANTLGNNLYAAMVRPKTIKWCARWLHWQHEAFMIIRQSTGAAAPSRLITRASSFHQLASEERKALIARASNLATMFWRLVAAIPPLVGSLFAADLSFSLLLAGVAGVYVAFFAPSLLQLASVFQGPTNSGTTFDGWYSPTMWCYPVLAFASFSLAVVVYQVRDAWLDMHR